jgi:hypothetical protein
MNLLTHSLKIPILISLLAAATVVNGYSQRIDSLRAGKERVVDVFVAPGHVTVLELPEQVTEVAVGNPLYKVEKTANRVMVQPLDGATAKTNLFVWSFDKRYAYQLLPATANDQITFAVDTYPIPVSIPRPEAKQEVPAGDQLVGAMSKSIFVWINSAGIKPAKDKATVYLRELIKTENQVVLQYVVENATNKLCRIVNPRVAVLDYKGSAHSTDRATQLRGTDGGNLPGEFKDSVSTVSTFLETNSLQPGEKANGFVVFKIDDLSKGKILALLFAEKGLSNYPAAVLTMKEF